MADLVDEAENNHELDQDTKKLIYQMDERWHTIDDWSNEREDKLTKVTADWRSLREEQKVLLEKLDAKDVTLKGIVGPVDLSNSQDTNGQRKELKVWLHFLRFVLFVLLQMTSKSPCWVATPKFRHLSRLNNQ